MSSVRHVDADHWQPIKGRLAHLPALLNPSEIDPLRAQPFNQQAMLPVSPPTQKRKRPRAARACEFCRAKKYRCDEQTTCSRCERRGQPCVYKDADSARDRLHSFTRHDDDGTQPTGATGNVYTSNVTREPDHGSNGDANGEVSEINPHTLNTEFHGPTSSLAFLAAVQQHPHDDAAQPRRQAQSLVSAFHNDSFSPEFTRSRTAEESPASSSRYHFRQSRFFLDGYFQNLHFIHPIIDKTLFLSKCEGLWFGRSDNQPLSFVALYYAVMSLGAIIQEWDEEAIDGVGRFDWAKKMYNFASDALESTPGHNDLHTVQACIIMAKVCQNELNPHLAYLYLGRAVRTALSAGFNRRSRPNPSASQDVGHADIAKTWWGLYSLEVEMSFALGRPDALGVDLFHNQVLPRADDTEHGILTPMVEFARIVRKVAMSVYAPAQSMSERLGKASEIQAQMDAWVDALPDTIRPTFHDQQAPIMVKELRWAKKQKHTLKFRYFNVTMVLYRPFLLHAAARDKLPESGLQGAVAQCVSAARATIELMHQMYCEIPYFRTWWYNVTYTLYAASIILCYLSRLSLGEDESDLQRHVDMAIDVLGAMEEHVVAKKAKAVLQQAAQQVREKGRSAAMRLPARILPQPETPLMHLANMSAEAFESHSLGEEALDPFLDVNLDFMGQLFPFDDSYLSSWPS